MSVSTELLCSFELLKPLDSNALKSHIKKGRNKRNQLLNSPVRTHNKPKLSPHPTDSYYSPRLSTPRAYEVDRRRLASTENLGIRKGRERGGSAERGANEAVCATRPTTRTTTRGRVADRKVGGGSMNWDSFDTLKHTACHPCWRPVLET